MPERQWHKYTLVYKNFLYRCIQLTQFLSNGLWRSRPDHQDEARNERLDRRKIERAIENELDRLCVMNSTDGEKG